jgi:hypothetical protein
LVEELSSENALKGGAVPPFESPLAAPPTRLGGFAAYPDLHSSLSQWNELSAEIVYLWKDGWGERMREEIDEEEEGVEGCKSREEERKGGISLHGGRGRNEGQYVLYCTRILQVRSEDLLHQPPVQL